MKALLINVFITNWKTTSAALATVVFWICDSVFQLGLTADQKAAISSILLTIGVLFAKDAKAPQQ